VIEMKKIITSICLIALVGFFVCSTASADEKICGCGKITAIQLYNSNGSDVPNRACKVAIDMITDIKPDGSGGQPYVVTATAFGTQINLALLKAFNYQEDIYICTLMRLVAPSRVTFKITDVTFPCSAVFPSVTAQDLGM
jgi:hypothetical protein